MGFNIDLEDEIMMMFVNVCAFVKMLCFVSLVIFFAGEVEFAF
jgi:hypothetical protein